MRFRVSWRGRYHPSGSNALAFLWSLIHMTMKTQQYDMRIGGGGYGCTNRIIYNPVDM